MRQWVWCSLMLACGGAAPDDTANDTADDTAETGLQVSDACALAEASQACPECDDGLVTCEYVADSETDSETVYSETANSCGDCQARAALYTTLCEAGLTDDTETIEAGVECFENLVDGSDDTDEPVDTGEASDACELAETFSVCPECYSGDVSCSYGETVGDLVGSCGDCQALGALYAELCADGNTDSQEVIEAGVECTEPVNPPS